MNSWQWTLLVPALALSCIESVTAQNIPRHCLYIQDVNDRITCLESGGAATQNAPEQLPTIRQARPPLTGPSFDCRSAATSIERAICKDPTLAESDYRMGQQLQQSFAYPSRK